MTAEKDHGSCGDVVATGSTLCQYGDPLCETLALRGRLTAGPIDTTNKHLVGLKGDSVVMMLPPGHILTRMEALTLAAWLVAVGDDGPNNDGEPSFEEILNAVLSA